MKISTRAGLLLWTGIQCLAIVRCKDEGSSAPQADAAELRDAAGKDMPKADGSVGSATWAACAVDVHQHLSSGADFTKAAANLVALMDELGIRRSLLLPPPASSDQTVGAHYDYEKIQPVLASQPGRLIFSGGGSLLNAKMHQAAVARAQPTGAELDQFEADARAIAAAGAAGFGETAVLHLSIEKTHPYIEIPADHPYYLRLADVAADVGLPIDIHLELVAEELDLPPMFKAAPQGNNPAQLKPNLAGFETLLVHNRKANIVWVHVGWDNTGQMTTARLRQLLTSHPNLYLALKMLDQPGSVQVAANRPLDDQGQIRPDWLQLITDYPDRFLLGADEFINVAGGGPSVGTPSTRGTWSLLPQLPLDLAKMIACENPAKIYKF
jgi:hypothetical protein